MRPYETANIKISPAEITKEIMRSAAVKMSEKLKTEQVEQRKNISKRKE